MVTAGGSPATSIVPVKLQAFSAKVPLTVAGPLFPAVTAKELQGPVKLPFAATVKVQAITSAVSFSKGLPVSGKLLIWVEPLLVVFPTFVEMSLIAGDFPSMPKNFQVPASAHVALALTEVESTPRVVHSA